MKNIRVIKTGINVSKIQAQLEKYPEDWGSQKGVKNAEVKDPHQYITSVDVLQLVMGGIEKPGQQVGDTEICIKTPAYKNHSAVRKVVRKYFPEIRRCGFLALPVDEIVGAHIDEGTYYLNKDRYHLSIQGQYQYFVGKESVIVDPGTLLWFNNKIPHGTVNLGDVTRITFVFDVPQ
tara:strand:- start:540 stop:1070 length:531 start_codon:yes stop_codon:yes gene_type:complete